VKDFGIPVLRLGKNLLVTLQTDLHDAMAEGFQRDVLKAIEKESTDGLLIDISGLALVDTYVAGVLANTARMAKLMGTITVIVGMRPEVAATLVQMGYMLDGIHTALNVEDGLGFLQYTKRKLRQG